MSHKNSVTALLGACALVCVVASPKTLSAGLLTWTGSTSNSWSLSGSDANWSGSGFVYTDGSAVTFPDAANNTNITIVSTGVQPSAVSFANSTTPYSFSGGAISGSATVTLSGAGGVTFDNANNYTGGTTVSAGTLNLAHPLAVQNSTVIVSAGGTLGFASGIVNPTLGGLAGSGSVNLTTAGLEPVTLTVGQNGQNTTYSGSLTGIGGLTKAGTSTLVISGVSSYSGPTMIDAGTLTLGGSPVNISGFGGNGIGWNLNGGAVASGDVLTLTDNTGEARSAFYNAKVPARAFTAQFVYTATGNAPLADGATFVLQNAGSNALGGGGSNLGYAGITPSAAVEFNVFSVNTVGTAYTTGGAITGMSSSSPVNLASGDPIQVTLAYDGSNLVETLKDLTTSATFSRTYPGVNLAAVTGGSSAFVGFTGGTGGFSSRQTIRNLSFTSEFAADNVLPVNTALRVAGGAILDLNGGSQTVASLSDGGGIGGSIINSNTGSASVLTLSPTGGKAVFSGAIQGGGASGTINLVISGAGTQVLAGSNSYSGTTTVAGGTLQLGDGTPGHDGSLAGNIVNNSALVFNLSANQSYSGAISGGGSLTKTGPGALTITGLSTFGGRTVVSGGTLRLALPSSLPSDVAGNLVVLLDATNAASLGSPSTGGSVTKWTNLATVGSVGNFTGSASYSSGNANFGGLPVVHFSNGQGLNNTSNFGNNVTVMYVGALDGTQNRRLVSGIGNNWLLGYWGGYQDVAYFNNWLTGQTVGATTAPHLYEGTIDGAGNGVAYSNGNVLGSLGSVQGPNGLGLGNGGQLSGEWANGSIGELLVYNTALSPADRQAVEAFLNYKWFGVTPNVLPNTTSVIISANATFDLAGVNQQVASLSDSAPGSGGSVINSASGAKSVLTLSPTGGTTTFSGMIQGGGTLGTINLVMSGGGTQVLAGSNTYTGKTTVNSGTLLATTTASLPAYSTSGSVVVAGGGVLGVQTGDGTIGWSQGQIDSLRAATAWANKTSGLGIDTTNGDFIYSGSINQPLTLTKLGPNTLTLTGSNSNTGGAKVSAGTLQFGDGTAGHDGAITGSIANNASLVFNFSGNQTYTGTISGSGDLTKKGPGLLTISGLSTYGGSTVIAAGTLSLQGIPTSSPPVPGYRYWFDASNLGLPDGAKVTQWRNKGSVGGSATVPTSASNVPPTYIANAGTGTDLGALAFSGNGNAQTSGALQFPEDTSIRTVFSIFKGASFLLTDSGSYDFHRWNSNDTDPTVPLWDGPSTSNWTSPYIKGGTTSVNGIVADWSTTNMPVIASQNGYNLVALTTTGPVTASSFNSDRVHHAGNQSQAEVILYDTPLSSSQMQQVERYLNAKWFGKGNILPSTTPVAIAAGAALDLGGGNQQLGLLSDYTPASGGTVINSDAGNAAVLTLGLTGGMATFSGSILGGGTLGTISLVISGSGTQVLAGSNTYTGSTTVSSGILLATTTASLPGYATASKVSIAAGAGLGVQTGNGTAGWSQSQIDALRSTAAWANNSVLGIDTTNGDFTYGENIAQAIGLTKLGANTLTLTGSNTYSGGTTVSAGTLQLSNASAVLNSTVTINADYGLAFAVNSLSMGGLAGSGAIALNSGADPVSVRIGSNGASSVYSGILSGPGDVTKVGSGTLTLTNTSSYTGPTAINTGTLVVNGALTSLVTVNNGGTLIVGNAAALGGGVLTLSGGTLQTTIAGNNSSPMIPNNIQINPVAGNALYAPSGLNLPLGGNLLGSGTVTATGAGSVFLSGSNGAFTGTYVNSGGSTWLNGPSAGSIAATWVLAGGSLGNTLTGQPVIDLGAFSGSSGQLGNNVSGSQVTYSIGALNTSTTYGGSIVDSLGEGGTTAVVKTGTGVLSLTNSSNYSGGTTINAGAIRLGNSAALGGGGLTVPTAGLLDLNGYSPVAGPLNGSGVIDDMAGGGNPSLTIGNGGGSGTFSGTIQNTSGKVTLVKTGSGIQVLTGINSQSGGTQINGGILNINSDAALGSAAAPLSFTGNGTLQAGADALVLGSSRNVSITAGAVATIDTQAFNTLITASISGQGGLTKAGAGTLLLTSSNSYSGSTTVSAGTLQLGDGTPGHDGSLAGNIVNNSSLVYSLNANQSYSGTISGSGGVTKTGLGTLVLSGGNTYAGPTVISGGKVVLASTLPQFSNVDISVGGATTPGSSQFLGTSGGALTIVAHGNDFWGGTEQGHFAYTTVPTNLPFDVAVHIKSLTTTNADGWSKSGIMARADASNNSVTTVFDAETSGNGVSFQWTDQMQNTQSGTAAPNWLRLTYNGSNTFIGYQSPSTSSTPPSPSDPSWVRITQYFATMPGSTFDLGIAASAHNDASTNTSYFDNLGTLLPLVPVPNTLPATTPLSIAQSATLDLNGHSQQFASLSDYIPGNAGIVINGTSTASVLTLSPTGGSTTFSGMIQGGGTLGTISLVINGGGTQVLSGSNTYSGTTTISAGTLLVTTTAALPAYGTSAKVSVAGGAVLGVQAGDGTAGWSQGQIDSLRAAATWASKTSGLGIDTTNGDFVYSGSMTQPLTLTKLGPNTLILTGSNTNSGGATVSAGTLQLGDGTPGHDGFLAGNIVNNAGLVYNFSADQSHAGAISGNGSLTKNGLAKLTLTGNITFSGQTFLTSGTLAIASPPAAGLYEGLVSSTSGSDTTDPIPHASIQSSARWGTSTTSGGNNVYPAWGNNTTWGYSAYLFNKSGSEVTYIFGKNFDDNGYLLIDGKSVINGTIASQNVTGSITLGPGLHTVDLRFGQLGGLVGPNGTGGNNGGPAYGAFGVGYNTVGNSAVTGAWLPIGAGDSNTQFYAVNAGGAPNSSVVMSSNTTLDLSASNTLGLVALGSLADASGSPTGHQVLLGGNTLNIGSDNSSTTFSGTISGSGGLIKQGAGTFALAGANTYTGDTVINSGKLNLAHPLAVQNSTVSVNSGGALSFAAGNTSPTLGGLAGTGSFALVTAASEPVRLNVGQNGQNTTYGGNLSGIGGLTKQGVGTLTLVSSQSYQGTTVINGGMLKLLPASIGIHFVGSGVPVTGSAGVVAMNNWNNLGGSNFTNTALIDDAGAATTANLTLAANGIFASGSSNELLNGYVYSNSYNPLSATISGIPYANYSLIAYMADVNTAGIGEKLTIGGTTYYYGMTNSPSYLQVTNTTAGTYPAGNYVVVTGLTGGTQTVTVQGDTQQSASFTGFEIVNTTPSGMTVLPATSALAISNGAVFDLDGVSQRQQVASLSDSSPGNGGSVINSNPLLTSVLSLSPTSGSSTFSGQIQGGGTLGKISLVMSGSGTQVLAGSNSYSGGTTINGGTLQAGNNAVGSASGPLVVNLGGTLDVHGYNLSIGALNGGGIIDNLSGSGSLTAGNGGASGAFSGTIQNTAGQLSLTKTGSGTLVLSGTNSYLGGTVVNGGTLILDSLNAIDDGTNLTVGTGASSFNSIAAGATALTSPPAAPVPEPGTLALLIAGAALLAMYRKRP